MEGLFTAAPFTQYIMSSNPKEQNQNKRQPPPKLQGILRGQKHNLDDSSIRIRHGRDFGITDWELFQTLINMDKVDTVQTGQAM